MHPPRSLIALCNSTSWNLAVIVMEDLGCIETGNALVFILIPDSGKYAASGGEGGMLMAVVDEHSNNPKLTDKAGLYSERLVHYL